MSTHLNVIVNQKVEMFRQRLATVIGTRSQAQFARDIGVNQQDVGRWLKESVPRIDGIIKIALAEKVSCDWMMGFGEDTDAEERMGETDFLKQQINHLWEQVRTLQREKEDLLMILKKNLDEKPVPEEQTQSAPNKKS